MLNGKYIWLYMFFLLLLIFINNLIKFFNGMVDIYFIVCIKDVSIEMIDLVIVVLNIYELFNNLILVIGVGLLIVVMVIVF